MPIKKRVVEPPRRSDEQFMRDVDDWPQWPYLPLKRFTKENPSGPPECGYMIHANNVRHCVFIGNIFEADIEADKKLEYTSFEAITADGWRVD